MKPNRIKLSDVADAAGVSAATVSRALRNPDIVSQKVRERIQFVIDELGYVPDPAARALASARTDVIGVLIPSVTNSVFADVLRGIYSAAEGTSYRIQLGNTRYSVLEEEKLLKVFLSQRPAGLIVTGIDQSAASRAMLLKAECPVVQIMETGDRPVDMMVGFSHREGAFAATCHLIENGYKRIAFLGARMDPRTQRRLEGFSQALREAGLLDERLIVTTPRPSTVTLGSELLGELLARAPDADAVFCNNDDLALGVLFECQRRRIAVPDELGICGFNDLEMMAVANPAITSVRTFREEMGGRAFELLLGSLNGAPVGEGIVDLGFELVRRESTRRSALN
ncbi:LacI family DNA-binding transcriptional regulator [Phyllobacterium leguminum]|uniref:LacI family transcriptional regulator n=1 Tax=Phyllobacterium leguminum TaxID=314237 RepID=A0A318T4Z7_9HYPH|nr:LacI family DNA-binding transcriptional regulator [Phyllobacterium leguminum]PYE90049.1 LacI family transcriptional regulator [Phyllobacterium leguminum]